MPISQERMIALTNAALDYQQGLYSFFDLANQLTEKVNRGEVTVEDALNQLVIFSAPDKLLANPAETMTTIALESRHWHSTAKRNIRERNRLRARRGTNLAVGESASTAPHSLSHTPTRGVGQNMIRQHGLARGTADYMKTTQPIAVDPLAAAAKHLTVAQRAAIDAEVERAAHSVIPPMSGDMAQDIADDMDDPLIPQANDGGDSDDGYDNGR